MSKYLCDACKAPVQPHMECDEEYRFYAARCSCGVKTIFGAYRCVPEATRAQWEAEASMHPTGRCSCAGEGRCEWCQWREANP